MRWSAVRSFVIKELKTFFRSKEDLFWVFAWPAIWVLMAAYVFIPPSAGQPTTIDLGVVDYDSSTTPFNGSLFVTILNESEYQGVKLFNVKVYDNESLMVDDIRHGRLDGGVVIPEGFGVNVTMGQGLVELYVGARDPYSAQITEFIVKGFIDQMNEMISMYKVNVTLNYMVEYSQQYGNASWFNESLMEFMRMWMIGLAKPINVSLFDVRPEALISREAMVGWSTIGAIGMTMLYSGFLIGAIMVVSEKETGTLRRLLASPASSTDMLVGKTIAGVILLGIMSIFVILLGVGACRAKIMWSPLEPMDWLVVALFALVALMTIGIGMLLSLVAKTTRGASGISVALGLMLAFMAGIWLPKSMMPSWMRVIGDYFPATWAIEAIRSIMVFDASFQEVAHLVLGVVVATVVIFGLGVIAYKKVLRRYVEV